MRFLTENPVAGGWLSPRATEAGVQHHPQCRGTIPVRKETEPWSGYGMCSPFAMHWSPHRIHSSATHLQNAGNDPSARRKVQAPQVHPESPLHLPHLWHLTLPSPLLVFLGCSGPTPPAGHLQAAGASPREDTGERDVPPRLAITASRKLVLPGSAPPELQ